MFPLTGVNKSLPGTGNACRDTLAPSRERAAPRGLGQAAAKGAVASPAPSRAELGVWAVGQGHVQHLTSLEGTNCPIENICEEKRRERRQLFPCVVLRPAALHAAGDAGDAREKHPLPVHPNRFGQAHVQMMMVSRCCLSPTSWSRLGTCGDGHSAAEQDWGPR